MTTKQRSNIYETLSLFSGGGFLDIGFINQGFDIKEAVEIVPHFINAYNFGIKGYFKKSKNSYIKEGLISFKEIECNRSYRN